MRKDKTGKDKTGKEKPELKNILKNINLGNRAPEKAVAAKKENIVPKSKKSERAHTVLDDVLESAMTNDYAKTRSVFIDEDVHGIFSLIKRHKKIGIGDLLSYLAENFISDNIKEITEINNNENKYLKK